MHSWPHETRKPEEELAVTAGRIVRGRRTCQKIQIGPPLFKIPPSLFLSASSPTPRLPPEASKAMLWPFDCCCGRRKHYQEGEREPLLPEDALPVPLPEPERVGGPASSQDQLRERKRQAAAREATNDQLRQVVSQALEQMVSLTSPAPFLQVYSSLADRPHSQLSQHSLHTVKRRGHNSQGSARRNSSNSLDAVESQQHPTSYTAEEGADVFHTAKSRKGCSTETELNSNSRRIPKAWTGEQESQQTGAESKASTSADGRPDLESVELLPTQDWLPVAKEENDMVLALPLQPIVNKTATDH